MWKYFLCGGYVVKYIKYFDKNSYNMYIIRTSVKMFLVFKRNQFVLFNQLYNLNKQIHNLNITFKISDKKGHIFKFYYKTKSK